jgi:hypothetical protein
LFRLSPLILPGSCTIANWLLSFDLIILRILRQPMAYAFSINNNLECLWLKF